jgi:hemerythrin
MESLNHFRMHSGIKSGNPLIDAGHKRLGALVGEVAGLWMMGADLPTFKSKLLEVREAIAQHFREEELILRASRYAGAEKHHQTHAGILEQLDKLIVSIDGDNAPRDRYRLVDRLESALFDHELMEDSDYLDHLQADRANMLVAWAPDLAMGIEMIDRHHQVLLNTFNRLVMRIHNQHDKDDVLDALSELRDHARIHFPLEEELLGRHVQEPFFEQHRRHHQEFLDSLESVIHGFIAGKENIRASVDGYLKYLLIEHMMVTDRRDLGLLASDVQSG